MKVYAISLERSIERRKHIVRHLEKRGLDYEIVPTVDGKELTASQLADLCDADALRAQDRFTSGVVGCALSHLNAYRKMLADEVETALIVEDDVILPGDIHRILKRIGESIEDGEIVLLHYFNVGRQSPVLSNADRARLDDRSSLLYPIIFPKSTAGYVISRKAAQMMAEIVLPVCVEADNWEYFYRCGAIESLRCVYPKPCETTQAETEVQVCSFEDISFRHRIWRFINNRRIPVVYRLACRYLRLKEKAIPTRLLDEPSVMSKPAAGRIRQPAVFQKQQSEGGW